jgi:hypothetical protein
MQPDFLRILNSDSSRMTADIATEAVDRDPDYFAEVLEISLNTSPPVNWRAARVIALSSEAHHELFLPYVNKIALLFQSFICDGLKRSYAQVLAHYADHLDEAGQAALTEICFRYIVDDEKPAVKYNCIKLLFELSKIHPDLRGELTAVIDFTIAQGEFKMSGELKRIYKAIEHQIIY